MNDTYPPSAYKYPEGYTPPEGYDPNWKCPDPGGPLNRDKGINCHTRPCECAMVSVQARSFNKMGWVCDCTSARVRDLAKGQFTVVVPDGECQWCGRSYQQANHDAVRAWRQEVRT